MEVVWLVDFDFPARSVPLDPFSRLVEGVGRPVAQQTPVERLDPGRRGFFPGSQRGHRHGFAAFRVQRDPFGPHRQHHRPARPARPGREDGVHLAQDQRQRQRQRQRQPVPPMVTLGQAAVVGGSDQPVDLRLPACPDHEFVDIAFPVGDVDPAGVGQTRGQFGAAFEAFQPAHAFLSLNRPVPFSSPKVARSCAHSLASNTPSGAPSGVTASVGWTYSPCCRRELNGPSPAMPGWLV